MLAAVDKKSERLIQDIQAPGEQLRLIGLPCGAAVASERRTRPASFDSRVTSRTGPHLSLIARESPAFPPSLPRASLP
jgi:hypothetical protein